MHGCSTRRRSWLGAILACLLLVVCCQPAVAGPPRVWPQEPIAGQQFTLIPDWSERDGPASYSWDLDGDGQCETAPTGTPEPVTLTRPAGEYYLWSCRAEEPGAEPVRCAVIVFVDDGRRPPKVVQSRETDTAHFLTQGANGGLTWDTVPPALTWVATYTTPDRQQSVPLRVTAATRGRESRFQISAPPAELRPPPGFDLGSLDISVFYASDPSYPAPRLVYGVEMPLRAHRLKDPCLTAFPTVSSTKTGGRTVYSRESSRRMVCQGFGAPEGLKFTAGMGCAVIAAMLPRRYKKMALFLSGSCAAAELAQDPDRDTALGVACGFLSELLGAFYPVAGKVSSLACASAPSIGQNLEARHELHVAIDVIAQDKCIQMTTGFFGISWSAVPCPPMLSSARATLNTQRQAVDVTLEALSGEQVTGQLLGSGAARRGMLVLGRASKRFTAAGRASFRVPLTPRGRKALRKLGRRNLTLKLTARLQGHAPVTVSKPVTLSLPRIPRNVRRR